MRILIETIDHADQRYPTVGDYQYLADGTIYITVSRLGDEKMETLVALHEFIEERLTKWRGIKEESITEFDISFEKDRRAGNVDEPGFNKFAPYRHEHLSATGIEMLMCAMAEVEWAEYNDKINSL